jgi:hypothetical protein
MTSVRNLISLVIMIFLQVSVYALEIQLECKVRGGYENENNMDAILVVTVLKERDFLSIDVDGPFGFAFGATTFKSSQNSDLVTKNFDASNDSNFAMRGEIYQKSNGNKSVFSININRVTGNINHSYVMTTKANKIMSFTFSGKCEKITGKNKF